MTFHFLGSFLLHKGLVTQDQLDSAIALQANTNQRLGSLAVEAGLLTPGQVLHVLEVQHSTDRSFGELAVSLGYVERAAMSDLVFRQQVRQTHLGEALLATGALTPEQFSRALCEYALEERLRSENLCAVLGSEKENPLAHALVAALERAFPRFVGCPLKAQGALPEGALERLALSYGCRVGFGAGASLRFELHFGAEMVAVLCDIFAADHLAEMETEESLEELLCTICAHLRRALAQCKATPQAGAAPRGCRVLLASPEADMGLSIYFE